MRAVVLAAVLVLGGCGAADPAPDGARSVETRAASTRFAQQCATEAASASVAVLCPTRLPLGGFESPRDYGDAPCSYLVNLEPRGQLEAAGAVSHLLFGGTCEPWSLATRDGRWPAMLAADRPGDDLRLVGTTSLEPGQTERDARPVGLRVLRRARVGSAAALVLRNPPYPVGGIHGGHISIVWNAGGAGYAVTGHPSAPGGRPDDQPDARSRERAIDTLIAVAGSMRRAPATVAPAACTRTALLKELRIAAPGSPASIRTLRCAPGYALTRVARGETRETLLWEDRSGRWIEVERAGPGACSAQAAGHGLCTPPPPDPELRRCSARAFVAALREDVDRLRFVIDRMRCRGDFAVTSYTVSDCLPEQTERRESCERTRVAAWRRDATRWRLVTYAAKLDCAAVRAAAPRFPAALCR